MARFDLAQAFTARWEGGLSDNPRDPGGLTNYGVSLRWLRQEGLAFGDVDGDGDIDSDDIRALTPDMAAAMFKKKFWDPYGLDLLPQLTATLHYDCTVNAGPRQATLITQRACNQIVGSYGSKLVVDGKFGTRTHTFLKQFSTPALAEHMLKGRIRFYRELAQSKPQFQCFLKGWLARCDDLRDYLEEQIRAWR